MMGALGRPAFARLDRDAEAGNSGARKLLSYWVGQGVGLVDSVQSAGSVVQEFKVELAEAIEDLMELVSAE